MTKTVSRGFRRPSEDLRKRKSERCQRACDTGLVAGRNLRSTNPLARRIERQQMPQYRNIR